MEVFSMTGLRYIISPIAALLFAPLFTGIINRTKALFSGRKGPSLVQPYFDLLRLFRKGTVYSKSTSWIFRAAPIIVFFCTLCATVFIPVIAGGENTAFRGDLVFFLYLLSFARFFLILSALDTGSSFEGMGASREAFYSAIAEPVAFLSLLNVMRLNHTTTLIEAISVSVVSDSIAVILAAFPMFIVLLAENARIPFDDPNTHLELTMIHEVMILDNSGPDLALFEYAAGIKIWLFALVVARIVLPVSSGTPVLQVLVLFGLMIGIAFLVGTVESIMARVRLIKVPQLLFGAGVLALLGFFISVTGVLSW